jgi:hypothetical protein
MVPEQAPGQPSDEYELVPRNQLEYLQHEVEKLRKNPFGDTGTAKDVLTGLDMLNKSVTRLIAIFETANDEIVRDYKDRANSEKISLVLEQNEKLAKGIVAIADLLKEVKTLRTEPWNPPPSPAATAPQPAPEQQPSPTAPPPLPTEWQSVITAPPATPATNPANPFIEQPPGGETETPTQPVMSPHYPYFGGQGAPQPPPQTPYAQQRRLPPIDFSEVPPPPRR